MQKTATRIFILSSVSFGMIGVMLVIATSIDSTDGGGPLINMLVANVL